LSLIVHGVCTLCSIKLRQLKTTPLPHFRLGFFTIKCVSKIECSISQSLYDFIFRLSPLRRLACEVANNQIKIPNPARSFCPTYSSIPPWNWNSTKVNTHFCPTTMEMTFLQITEKGGAEHLNVKRFASNLCWWFENNFWDHAAFPFTDFKREKTRVTSKKKEINFK
jgi:hypothetical protein